MVKESWRGETRKKVVEKKIVKKEKNRKREVNTPIRMIMSCQRMITMNTDLQRLARQALWIKRHQQRSTWIRVWRLWMRKEIQENVLWKFC